MTRWQKTGSRSLHNVWVSRAFLRLPRYLIDFGGHLTHLVYCVQKRPQNSSIYIEPLDSLKICSILICFEYIGKFVITEKLINSVNHSGHKREIVI